MIQNIPSNIDDRFTKTIDLLYLVKQNGIEIILKDGELQLKLAENQSVNEDLLGKIRENKQAIIDFLGNKTWKSKIVTKNHNTVNKVDRNEISRLPLSFSQERLWFIDQLEGSIQYHSADILKLEGVVDAGALQDSLRTIVNRHEVLRTIIKEDEIGPVQQVKEKDNFKLALVHGGRYQYDQTGLADFIDQLNNQPFDLSKDDMLRATLITVTDEEHILVLTLHHIASDGWSRAIFLRELASLYETYVKGVASVLPEPKLQFVDFAVWQRQHLQGNVLQSKIEYWKQKLEDVSPLALPTDYPRPMVPGSKGTSIDFKIDAKLSSELKQLSQQHGVTLFITLLAAFKVLLHRYSGQEDISVGTSIADRPQREVEELIGFFVNTLALRSQVKSNASFIELLQEVKTTTLEAYEHQDLPFEKVVEAAVKERDTRRHPLFQVMLVLSNTAEEPEIQLGQVSVKRQAVTHNTSKFDLTFFLLETAEGLQLTLAYSTDLFSSATIERMLGHFNQLLQAIATNPGEKVGKLRMVTPGEEKLLLSGFNTGSVVYPEHKSIVDLFEERVQTTPDNIAVVFEGRKLSFKQLNEKANQLAAFLVSQGIDEKSMVPLCIERSPEMIVGILAILKAGAAYLPIDPDYPADRINYMLLDSNAAIVVTSQENRSKFNTLPDSHVVVLDNPSFAFNTMDVGNLSRKVQPTQLAYVIYTSGSTGKPKGVMIEHRSLVDYVYGLKEKLHTDKCGSFALVSSISTDLGNTVLFPSLVFGGALHLFSKEAINDADILKDYFREHSIDCLKIVPSHWKALSTDGKLLLPSKMLIFGGEALPAGLTSDIRLSGSACKIINHYGPTETTIGKLLHVVDFGRKYNQTIPVGKPFSNTRVYVLSGQLELCPIGVPGELLIAGAGVARGYVNQDRLTSDKFIQNPFDSNDTSFVYRTGDLVRYLEDGNIEFIGRIDGQVKIRGFRIEPGEIESTLNACEQVKQAVVLVKDDTNGNNALVAYVVPDGRFDRASILSYLGQKLPEYMIPTLWVELDSFPLLGNGKIDRKALPDPGEPASDNDGYVSPRNELEVKLAAIWQDLLEVDRVGINDDFFELGGHSLLAIQLISTMRRQLKLEVRIGDIFDYPNIASLAAQLHVPADNVVPVISVKSRPRRIPLSFNQERLWFIDQMEGSVQYHRPDVLRLKGEVDKNALNIALQTIINRHEVLRTVILNDQGEPHQYVKEKDNWRLTFDDSLRYQDDVEGLQQYIDRLIKEPFDLSKDHMIRAQLIKLYPDEHMLVVTMHHIASDGWSLAIFNKELAEIYRGLVEATPPKLQPLPIQYADFSIWQREQLQGQQMDKKLEYWKSKLAGVAPLQLPTDYHRPAYLTNKGALASFNIEKSVLEGLQKLSQEQGTTLFMIMLAAFKVLLHRYSGQSDICVGSATAGRQQQEVENLIGFFVNTLALRSNVDDELTFIEFLQTVRATTVEAYDNQEVSFDKVVNAVVKERDINRTSLFQVMFDLGSAQNTSRLNLERLEILPEFIEHKTTKFDLSFSIAQVDSELKGYITYSTDLYSEETILRMAGHYNALLSSIIRKPGQTIGGLSLLTQNEEQQLLVDFNNTKAAVAADKTVIDLFEDQVRKTPDEIAVISDNERLTYTQLNSKVNQLAYFLRQKGVTAEMLVPMVVDRSMEMIIGIMGIIKAGCAYVPIDPAYPADRINFMIKDAGARFTLTTAKTAARTKIMGGVEVVEIDTVLQNGNRLVCDNPQTCIRHSQLVYVIYTSGSTGQPKGVMIEHRSLLNYLKNSKTSYIRDEDTRSGSLIHLSYTFDASLTALFMPLIVGKSVVISSAPTANVFDEDLVHTHGPYSFIKATPSHLALLQPAITGSYQANLTGRLVIGGEALFISHFDYLISKGVDVEVINEYGPTEATVGCSTYTFNTRQQKGTIKDRILIGKPIDNVQMYILDSNSVLSPIGVVGEICIGGAGLARGYFNRPDLTAQKFVTCRVSKNGDDIRIYKTGDLGRWLADGNIEYLGRKDDQVKIRGYRIELGEIESVLQGSPLVKQGAVVAREDSAGTKRLVGYVVPADYFDRNEIISYLEKMLPEYMVPDQWVELESMPVTQNGKIDRRSLPEPGTVEGIVDEYMPPTNELQRKLAGIWEELLEVESVGIHDNFFQLGGHSLLAIQMISIIRKELQIELALKDLFQFSTIDFLSRYLEIQKNPQTEEKDMKEFELINI